MLLSASSNQVPTGSRNFRRLLSAKNLMPNSSAIAFGVFFDEKLNDYKAPAFSRIMHDFTSSIPKLGLYGGGGLDAAFRLTPIRLSPKRRSSCALQMGAGFKQTLAHNFTRTATIFCQASRSPSRQRFSSIPTWKDALWPSALRRPSAITRTPENDGGMI